MRHDTLDNIALVPASLLPYRAHYQALANRLPDGDVLIVFPPAPSKERRVLETVATLFRARGRHVATALASALTDPTPNAIDGG